MSGWVAPNGLPVTTNPPFEPRANSATAGSKASALFKSIALNSIPIGATAWIAANWPIPAAMAESRRTAARVMLGAISLSTSSHFAAIAYSNAVNPVALPPGRARLLIKPAPTGSMTPANTIGTVRVACCNTAKLELPSARMTSGASATNSLAYRRLAFGITRAPANLEVRAATISPT
jgi:hypothetical protein